MMGLWDLYFIAKLYLYFGHFMGFHAWPNLAFALFLIAPVPGRLSRLKFVRRIVAFPVGIALFYYDTWLPPVRRVIQQTPELKGFTLPYLLELIGRFFNPWVVAGLVLAMVIYFFARKRLRISSFIFLAMLVLLLPIGHAGLSSGPDGMDSANAAGDPGSDANLTTQLDAFFRNEAGRTVSFTPPAKTDAPFDIIFVQICSLSWDDIDFTKQRDNPIFRHFNIVFTDFNSAASYSGPAAIRLLRGSCGQPMHKALYAPPSSQCLTFDNLQRIGFEPEIALNHDGHYGGFLDEDIQVRGGLKATPFDTKDLPTYLQAFDGSPIHDDYAVLTAWWEKRVQSQAERVALYYNTISLHDGDQYQGRRSNSMEIYPARLTQLFADLDNFFKTLQASGRKAVVVVLGEHGASIRGDKMQIAGLREIPTPRITTVPVGIKLVGFSDDHADPVIVSEPTSYLAISKLLSEFIAVSPFGANKLSLEDYVRDLPSTEFVSQNEDIVVMKSGKQYFIHSRDADWVPYDPSN